MQVRAVQYVASAFVDGKLDILESTLMALVRRGPVQEPYGYKKKRTNPRINPLMRMKETNVNSR
jgi:hypothetical protein